MTERQLDRIFASYTVINGHLIWTGRTNQIRLFHHTYSAYRAVWAAILGTPINEVPKGLVPGCGVRGCVEPTHRVEGPHNAPRAGWLYDFVNHGWLCARKHRVGIVGQNRKGECRGCARARKYDV